MSLLDQIETDLDVFVETDDFAIEATWTRNGAAMGEFNALFDKEYEAVNLSTGMIESNGPRAVAKDEDIDGLKHGDELTIDDVKYYVAGLQPDGTGLTTIILSV